jgi:hypothetical protein
VANFRSDGGIDLNPLIDGIEDILRHTPGGIVEVTIFGLRSSLTPKRSSLLLDARNRAEPCPVHRLRVCHRRPLNDEQQARGWQLSR